jgi:molybdenum cofactor guanylyltransferase
VTQVARASRCGVLLAGGLSRRFGGTPKGLSLLNGERVADRVINAMAMVCDEIMVAANDTNAAGWFPGRSVVADPVPGLGALGGIATALTASRAHTTLVCAWDMPFVTASLLASLVDAVDAGARWCVPFYADGRAEPLCAAYSAACEPMARSLLAAGERAAHALCATAGGTPWVIADHLSERDAARIFFNVNTPHDLQHALQWLIEDSPSP